MNRKQNLLFLMAVLVYGLPSIGWAGLKAVYPDPYVNRGTCHYTNASGAITKKDACMSIYTGGVCTIITHYLDANNILSRLPIGRNSYSGGSADDCAVRCPQACSYQIIYSPVQWVSTVPCVPRNQPIDVQNDPLYNARGCCGSSEPRSGYCR